MLCFIVNEHSRSGKGAKIWKEAEAVLKKGKTLLTNHTSPNMRGMPFHWHMTSVNVGRMTFNLSW